MTGGDRSPGAVRRRKTVTVLASLVSGGALVAGAWALGDSTTVALTAVLAAAIVSVSLAVALFSVVGGPDQVLVVSGRRYRGGDGEERGYRLVVDEGILRMPVVERVTALDCRSFEAPVRVMSAYTSSGQAISLSGIATVRICRNQPDVHNAVERFLGSDRDEIGRVAAQTLEGNLRAVLAQLTVEEVKADRTRLAESVLASADEDLRKLGLRVDSLVFDR